MGEQHSTSVENDEIQELREAVDDLKDHIRVLIEAIDDVREEIGWLLRNRLGATSSQPVTSPVLKRMAADPCAGDWNERLMIVNGKNLQEADTPDLPSSDPQNTIAPPGRLF